MKTQKVCGYLNIASGAPGVAGDIHRKKNTTIKQTTNHTKQQRGTQNKKSKNSKIPNTTYDVMQELIPTDNQTPEACTEQQDFFFSR